MSSSFGTKTVRTTHHVFLVMDYRCAVGDSDSVPPISTQEMIKNAMEKALESLSHSLDAKFDNFAKRFFPKRTRLSSSRQLKKLGERTSLAKVEAISSSTIIVRKNSTSSMSRWSS